MVNVFLISFPVPAKFTLFYNESDWCTYDNYSFIWIDIKFSVLYQWVASFLMFYYFFHYILSSITHDCYISFQLSKHFFIYISHSVHYIYGLKYTVWYSLSIIIINYLCWETKYHLHLIVTFCSINYWCVNYIWNM